MTPRPDRLCRSMLFVPGSRPDMIEKAAGSDADAVCLDLEDAVAPDGRRPQPGQRGPGADRARFRRPHQAGPDQRARHRISRTAISSTSSSGGRVRVDCVMLPKAGGPEDVGFVDTLLTQIERQTGAWNGASASRRRSRRRAGFLWRAGDRAGLGPAGGADLRLGRLRRVDADAAREHRRGRRERRRLSRPSLACGDARGRGRGPGQRTPGASRARTPTFRDDAGLERACRIARAMGFDGKQCIHPAQLASGQRRVLASARRGGLGPVGRGGLRAGRRSGPRARSQVEGKMIDAVNLRMAMTTLRRADAIAAKGQGAIR